MLRDIIHTYLIKVAGEFTTFYKTVIPLVVLNESIPGGVIAEKHLVACISGGGIISHHCKSHTINGVCIKYHANWIILS